MATAQVVSSTPAIRHSSRRATAPQLKCRRKFLQYFPGGFADETYLDWERNYKWEAHERWEAQLGRDELRVLLREGN
jgi:hypothetical protein